MRREITLALGLAGFSGMFAAFLAYDWLGSMASRDQSAISAPPQIPLSTIVVAKEDMTFGTVLSADKLKIVEWPTDNMPAGAYASIDDIFKEQETRTVLETIQTKEPIVKGKITGPGQRASLSTMLRPDMKAVTVRVDDILGVGGFVLPGDYVDVLVTFGKRSEDAPRDQPYFPYTDLMLQRLRVLAIDQSADPRESGARLARSVTLEANQRDAQKITLASNIATVSLVLREPAQDAQRVSQRRITSEELGEDSGDKQVAAAFEPTIAVAPQPAAEPSEPVARKRQSEVRIWRGKVDKVEKEDVPVVHFEE